MRWCKAINKCNLKQFVFCIYLILFAVCCLFKMTKSPFKKNQPRDNKDVPAAANPQSPASLFSLGVYRTRRATQNTIMHSSIISWQLGLGFRESKRCLSGISAQWSYLLLAQGYSTCNQTFTWMNQVEAFIAKVNCNGSCVNRYIGEKTLLIGQTTYSLYWLVYHFLLLILHCDTSLNSLAQTAAAAHYMILLICLTMLWWTWIRWYQCGQQSFGIKDRQLNASAPMVLLEGSYSKD